MKRKLGRLTAINGSHPVLANNIMKTLLLCVDSLRSAIGQLKLPVSILSALCLPSLLSSANAEEPPNILFFFVDDWGRYASIYADPEKPSFNDHISTPNFDRIGREGVIFENAFVPVASCGPCRASLATGRHFWNCGSGAFLKGKESDWKGQDNPFRTNPKFVDLLREGGYHTARSGKTFSFKPSRNSKAMQSVEVPAYQRYGLYVGEAKDEKEREKRREETLAHPRMVMRQILADKSDKPFFLCYGTINVHRPYTPDSGAKLWNIDPDMLKGLIPKFLPDEHDVRRDFSDYLGEVMAADAMLGEMIAELEKAGKLDETLVIISGDHGIPGVPRGKTTCYDLGTSVSLMVRWPKGIPAGRRVEDYISIMDVGPTLLDVARADVPDSMDGRSFLPQLKSEKSGWIDKDRNWVILGRERHVPNAREGDLPYPMRAIRTPKHLYIRNFKPDRWPMGDPGQSAGLTDPKELYQLGLDTRSSYGDLDGSLTKAWLLANRTFTDAKRSIDLTLGKRPAEEFYRITSDPDHLTNIAGDESVAEEQRKLAAKLMAILESTNDPRLTDAFDRAPWVVPGEGR